MPAEALVVIRKLSDLHRTALTTLHGKDPGSSRYAYEVIAEEMAEAMMSIARGTDPAGTVEDLQEAWFRLADGVTDGDARRVFTSWAGQVIRTIA